MKQTSQTCRRLGAAILGLGLLFSNASAQQGPPPSPVRVDPVRSEQLQEMRRVTGQLRAAQRSTVATREAGLVREILVREGERVEKGAVLVRLDRTRLDRERAVLAAQEKLAAAVVVERLAILEQAQRDRDALVALAERDAVSPKELADAKTTLVAAQARIEQGREEIGVLVARRAELELRIADTETTAPFTGTVVARHTEVGAWVGTGGALVEIISSDALEAWIDVPQAWFGALSTSTESMRLEFDATGGEAIASSWRLLPDIAAQGRTFPLIAPLAVDSPLAPGMSVTANVPTGARAGYLTVARDAILRGETGAFIYVAKPTAPDAPPTAAFQPVEVLFRHGDRAAVRAPGLAAGDLVVVEGNERLFPSAPLLPQPIGGDEGGKQR